MNVIYVGPFDAVRIIDQGAEIEVVKGTPVSVHPDTGGRAPVVDAEGEMTDPGSGLLAQPSNWQPAPAAKPKTSKEGE